MITFVLLSTNFIVKASDKPIDTDTSNYLIYSSVEPVKFEGEVICRGRWGKQLNQIGLLPPAPGVLPTTSGSGPGGYDISADGTIWISDSVNRKVKSYSAGKWKYIMVNADRLGDLVVHDGLVYVVTRSPDGVIAINPQTGKTEQRFSINFSTPGRLGVFKKGFVGVEDISDGLWLSKGDKSWIHPAAALEAIGNTGHIYGLEYNIVDQSRSVIKTELATQDQEPEFLLLFEIDERIVFNKLAGLIGEDPVIMVVTHDSPSDISFKRLDTRGNIKKTITLPTLHSPWFAAGSWRLASDGHLYGFEGCYKRGFRLLKSAKSF